MFYKKKIKHTYSCADLELVKSFSQLHFICKQNLPLDTMESLNIFMEGNGIGKTVSYAKGDGPANLLKAMDLCQISKDKKILQNKIFSACIDENTTRAKPVSAIFFRFFFFFFCIFCSK